MSSKQVLDHKCIHIKNMSYVFATNDGKTHTLPRIPGFLPRNDDLISIYDGVLVDSQTGKEEKVTRYFWDDKKDNQLAVFTKHSDGRFECKVAGEGGLYKVAAKDMADIKANDIGELTFEHDWNGNSVGEPLIYPSGKKLALIGAGSVAATMLTGVGEVALLGLTASGKFAYDKIKASMAKTNNKGEARINIADNTGAINFYEKTKNIKGR